MAETQDGQHGALCPGQNHFRRGDTKSVAAGGLGGPGGSVGTLLC